MTAAFLLAARRRQDGQGLVEYSLIVGMIAIVAISALMFIGQFFAMPDLIQSSDPVSVSTLT